MNGLPIRSLISSMKQIFSNLQIVALQVLALLSINVNADGHTTSSAGQHANYQRIVSIGGAITETIFALKQGHRIVGTDTTSYYPPAAEQTPKVGYQRTLSAEGILSLQPDVIIASDHAGPPKVIEQLKATGTPFLKLETPDDIDNIVGNIRQLATWLNTTAEGKALEADIRRQERELQALRADADNAPAVVFVLQHGGGAPMVAGSDTSAAQIIQLAGGKNAVSAFEGYKPLTPEALLAAAPKFILTTNMGLEKVGGADSMLEVPGVKLTPAGKQKNIIAMDGLLLLGFGPRTPEAALQLHRMLTN